MHIAHNARLQLVATMINNGAVAFIVAGFVAPLVTGQFRGGSGVVVFFIWFGIGMVLHLIALTVLGTLRA